MRVTLKMLQNRVVHLNKMLGRPVDYFSKNEDGFPCIINIGHFHIDCAYGGYQLAETCKSGGTIDVFNHGHIPARELLELICAFEIGYRFSQDQK